MLHDQLTQIFRSNMELESSTTLTRWHNFDYTWCEDNHKNIYGHAPAARLDNRPRHKHNSLTAMRMYCYKFTAPFDFLNHGNTVKQPLHNSRAIIVPIVSSLATRAYVSK
jgi:hypothetical protein